jgi:hypothetical protein
MALDFKNNLFFGKEISALEQMITNYIENIYNNNRVK